MKQTDYMMMESCADYKLVQLNFSGGTEWEQELDIITQKWDYMENGAQLVERQHGIYLSVIHAEKYSVQNVGQIWLEKIWRKKQ